ncbi:signal peptide, CUB and EGF-like domain-containing protein 3, partial [Gigantopelta aegis]|uniref:signal peptide, CUB and EGF-like domain-containing protein 3 n=1 Tax=Gigantopelta aegis TaxID=1735272 RepID=UPI001B88C3C3
MCPIGQYQPVKWQFECMRCNENYTTKSEGSTSVNNCTFYCPEGYEVESAQNEKCRICPRGTYRQNKGNERFSPCQNCTQNTTDGPGSKSMADCSISICTAGQKITNNQCDDCPVDTYQNVTLPDSNTRCMNCTDGFGTMTTKSTAETNCT